MVLLLIHNPLSMLTQSNFQQLADQQSEASITIYLPTHRAGQPTYNGQDRIVYKDLLKQLRHRLETLGTYSRQQINERLDALDRLDEDSTFWRHQSDTLAIYYGDGEPQVYNLPIQISSPQFYVESYFVLTPAAEMLHTDGRYYLFCLAMGANAFYEATRHTITSIFIADHVPANMDESLEGYVNTDGLQWHGGGTSGSAGTIFHGQGSNEDRLDVEKTIYYLDVANGLDLLLAGQHEPLMLVCAAQHLSDLRETINYPHVLDEALTADPANFTMAELHTETWAIIKSHFDRSAETLTQTLDDAIGSQRFAAGAQSILPAAMRGQVASLFITKGAEPVWGHYIDQHDMVEYHSDRQPNSQDLLEATLRQVLATGGEVVVRGADEMQASVDGLAATLRYTI